MGKNYAQLTLEERIRLAQLSAEGLSIRQIAADMDRSPSTIAREVKRNVGRQVGYKPAHAQEKTRARRWKGSRLERDPALAEEVLTCLKKGWSPEQTCAFLARVHGKTVISPESIYRFIYAQIRRTKDYRWRHYLPRAKSKRGRFGRRGGSSALHIHDRVSIAERPAAVENRSSPGHWEADLMLFAKYGQAILALHERSSRLLIALQPPNRQAALIARSIASVLAPLPAALRQTITFDNGTEFARHYELHQLDIATFFCDPYAPWQKGGIENAIGRMRRTIPRKTDLTTVSARRLSNLIADYNNTPRKCLDWHTPAELFLSQLLHFERESTFQLARE
jgi:IS30 family transposase